MSSATTSLSTGTTTTDHIVGGKESLPLWDDLTLLKSYKYSIYLGSERTAETSTLDTYSLDLAHPLKA